MKRVPELKERKRNQQDTAEERDKVNSEIALSVLMPNLK